MRGVYYLSRQRWVLWTVLAALSLYVVACLFARLAAPPPTASSAAPTTTTTTTLTDPDRLQRTLTLFANTEQQQPPPAAAAAGQRHQTESLCRSLLEAMLGFPLPKCRPRWLLNPTTRRALELDMYNEEHRIAFEYDGAQHSHFTPHFHQNEDHFQYRKLLDQLKTDLCREAGVLLIRIPWQEVSGPGQGQAQIVRCLEGLLWEHDVAFTPIPPPTA